MIDTFDTNSLQLLIVLLFAAVNMTAIICVVWFYSKRKIKGESKPSENSVAPQLQSPVMTKQASLQSLKKSISFNTVYNLEEFMVRLYKVGFLVFRLKETERKPRFITIDRKGNICFHKTTTAPNDELTFVKVSSPYFKMPVTTLKDCFACDDSSPPSFIMEFASKTLHLAADTALDRNYYVKGFKLVMQRAKSNSNFILRSSQLLDAASPNHADFAIRTIPEDDDAYTNSHYDDDNMTVTTMGNGLPQ